MIDAQKNAPAITRMVLEASKAVHVNINKPDLDEARKLTPEIYKENPVPIKFLENVQACSAGIKTAHIVNVITKPFPLHGTGVKNRVANLMRIALNVVIVEYIEYAMTIIDEDVGNLVKRVSFLEMQVDEHEYKKLSTQTTLLLSSVNKMGATYHAMFDMIEKLDAYAEPKFASVAEVRMTLKSLQKVHALVIELNTATVKHFDNPTTPTIH